MRKTMRKFIKRSFVVTAFLLCFAILTGVANWGAFFSGKSGVYALGDEQYQIVPLDYTISLDYQGGSRKVGDKEITSDSIKITSNRKIMVATPTKKGYAFYGFFDENAKKYFDDQGDICEGIVFTNATPKTLFAAWVKLSSGEINTYNNGDPITTIDKAGGPKYSNIRNIGLDIVKLEKLRYTKIQVNLKIDLQAKDKGDGRDIWLDIGQNSSYKNVWQKTNLDLQNTNRRETYYSILLNINEFNNNSQFRIGFNQTKSGTWWVYESYAYFTAVEQAPITPLTKDSRILNTTTHSLGNVEGYQISSNDSKSHPLGGNYAEISLRYNGGKLLNGGNQNFGYVADKEFSGEEDPKLELALKYNYSSATNINGTKWNMGYDGWSGAICGVNGAGVVQSGALLIQKSTDGVNWTWENPYNNGTTESFHTVDFANNYLPEIYNGNSHVNGKISAVEERDADGNIVYTKNEKGEITGIKYIKNADGSMAHQEEYAEMDGYLSIYQPSGDDLKNGIYIRVLFAYELSYYEYYSGWEEFFDGFIRDTKTWYYTHVVEETVLYVCNSSGNILFQNMNFTSASENEPVMDEATSGLIRQFGTVKDGHVVNDGFRVNFNGNTSYEVRYKKNGCDLNNVDTDPVYDGRIFMEPGKYEFEVTPKFGETKKTTIYINDRGLNQNYNYYFGDGFITNDSERLYAQLDMLPVYKEVKWSTAKLSDENHSPIAGRVGLYQETLSIKDFNSKYYIANISNGEKIVNNFALTYKLYGNGAQDYFVFTSRMEVDSNYVSTSNDGFMSYRLEVEEGYEPKDGDGFIAYKDVIEKDGKKYIGTIYGTFKTEDGKIIIGTIDAYDVFKIVGSKLNDSREAFVSAPLTEVGNYIGEFTNNLDYFKNVELSGDILKYIFQFKITDEKAPPSINKEILGMNVGFSDYLSKYYGVPIKSAGEGIATFVYFDYGSAYNCAYEYARSLVTLQEDGSYKFLGDEYGSQFAVLSEVDEFAKNLISTNYFDGSIPASYRTYYGKITDILNTDLKSNVVVFDSSVVSYGNAIGIPFLNDRPYSYIDENGDIFNGVNEIRFISAADFESSKVTLIYLENDKETEYIYDIPYGAPVEATLYDKKAPSGKYKIVETNKYGEKTEYYGIYIRKNENTTILDITRINGENAINQTLSGAYLSTQFTVNSFIIHSAKNTLDPYGIMKVSNTAGYKKVYQLDEVDNIILQTRGDWTIELVDRLGNKVSFFVTIYTPKEVHTLTLINKGEEYSTQLAADGERIYLKTLSSVDPDFEFIGWEDENGNIYNKQFIFKFNKDTTLTAVWRYVKTTISIYDGGLVKTYNKKPGETIRFDSLTKTGFELYGYKYEFNGETRFCIGQLNSVPNVQSLTLNAVWMDKSNSITASFGDTLLPPEVKDGMIFYGWATADRGANALIFTNGKVDIETDEPLTLYALFITDEAETQTKGVGAGFLNFINNIFSGINGIIMAAFLVLCLIAVVLLRRKNRSLSDATLLNINLIAKKRSLLSVFRSKAKQSGKKLPLVIASCRRNNPIVKKPFRFKNLFTPMVCGLLVIVFAFTFSFNAIFNGKTILDNNAKAAATEKQISDYNENLKAKQEALKAEQQARDSYINQASALYAAPQNVGSDEIFDEKEFLYSLMFLDLASFGYDVFPALAYIDGVDKPISKGFGYTNYNEIYTQSDDETIYIGVGFVSLIGDENVISQEDSENGIIISPIESKYGEELFEETYGYKFILSFEPEFYEAHYIAYNYYVRYQIHSFGIEIKENIEVGDGSLLYDNESLLINVKQIGYLYNYDLDRAVYDPYLGDAFDKDGYSLTSGLDYEASLEAYQIPINLQNKEAVTLESTTITAISIEALNEFLLLGQDERFLGISAEQIYQIESQIDKTVFYYVDGVTGAIGTLDVASVLEIIKQSQGTVWDTVWKALSFALSVVSIVVGVILCCTPAAALGVGLIIGGVIGITAQYFQDEISNFIVGLLGQDGAKAAGGGMTIVMGGLTINVGTKLIGKAGWIGTAAGVLLIIIGAVLIAFGLAEITEVAFDYNFIKEWTGISDLAYSNLLKGLNFVATVAVIAYNVVTKYYKKMAEIDALKKIDPTKSIKQLRREAVAKAWEQERALVASGKPSTIKDITPNQIEELLTTGKIKGYYGHHINSVKAVLNPENNLKFSLISNPNNIKFLTFSEHLAAHFGNFRNETLGNLITRLKGA